MISFYSCCFVELFLGDGDCHGPFCSWLCDGDGIMVPCVEAVSLECFVLWVMSGCEFILEFDELVGFHDVL